MPSGWPWGPATCAQAWTPSCPKHGFDAGAQAHTAYVFANRNASCLKALLYDAAGLWLCTRRLQQGRFAWPKDDNGTLTISPQQWEWLIAGAPWQRLGVSHHITVV